MKRLALFVLLVVVGCGGAVDAPADAVNGVDAASPGAARWAPVDALPAPEDAPDASPPEVDATAPVEAGPDDAHVEPDAGARAVCCPEAGTCFVHSDGWTPPPCP